MSRRSSERGFVLIAALCIALLYLGLMELLLIDGARALHEAQRFRARVVAATLAENGAELAARQMVFSVNSKVDTKIDDGAFQGTYARSGDAFELTGRGESAGVVESAAEVYLQGRIVGTRVMIDYAVHTP